MKELHNETPKKQFNPAWLTIIVGSFLSLLALVPVILNLDSTWERPEVHSSLEGIGGVMCLILSFILANEKNHKSDYPVLFLISIAFFIIGTGNILHSFHEPNKLFIFYHGFAGFFSGIISLFIFIPRVLSWVSQQKMAYIVITSCSLFIYLIFIAFPDFVPYMGNEDSFSTFAIILNLVAGSTLLLLTIKLLAIQVDNKTSYSYSYTNFSLIFIVFAVSYLAFFTSVLWDISWWIWHLYIFIAITLVVYSIISYQKNLIETLNNSKEVLEFKNKELEQFTYITSHDLQEPLNSILSFSSLLKQSGYSKLDKIGQQSVTIIEQSSNRMKAFITSLLEYSRIGREKVKTEIKIKELLNDIKNDLHDLVEKEDATLKYIGEDITLRAYETDLEKLFQNIIINGIKYKKEDEKPFIVINSKELKNAYEFVITDNGIGIEEEYFNIIFEVFERLHTKDKYEGTGIGLAHCKKIVELHQGDIWLESTPGKGSKFYFTITKY